MSQDKGSVICCGKPKNNSFLRLSSEKDFILLTILTFLPVFSLVRDEIMGYVPQKGKADFSGDFLKECFLIYLFA